MKKKEEEKKRKPPLLVSLSSNSSGTPAAAFLDLSVIRGIRIWVRVPVDDFEALINDGHEERPSPTKRNRGNCVSALLIYATPSLSSCSKRTPAINNCLDSRSVKFEFLGHPLYLARSTIHGTIIDGDRPLAASSAALSGVQRAGCSKSNEEEPRAIRERRPGEFVFINGALENFPADGGRRRSGGGSKEEEQEGDRR
ncbi:hypothetical protein V1477_011312 [Vespula maculifrons]|uniref:Uncharacterized protein n=1 Tax=Vespula maculifrons TaxID=7453 RepID=A0ABD2C6D3_VESMC